MASWHFQQLKFALGLGGIVGLYGGTSAAVYVLGEYAGVRVSYRVAIIAVVLLTLPFALLIGHFATRKKKKQEAAEEAAEQAAEEGGEAPERSAAAAAAPSGNFDEELNKGADEVVKFLKSSNLGAMGDALYSLPWYLVTGATKSGKTSLVLGSDLNFQTLPSQRQAEQNIVRPTRHIDWRITSDAVFVDTPGRLQNGSGDGDEWASLLEAIKKHRSNRPLDGLILTVNTEKILHSDESEIEDLAKTIRARLDDATKRLSVRFPVYLVFTHADAIEGFRDSFSVSKKEGENLVWGATIPLEKSDNAQALFDSEYEVLQDSIMKRRMIRLSAPFSPLRQLRIFNFPLHFGSARRKLGTFVTTLFRPNPFSESPFLRGFYFTAVPVNRKRKQKSGKPAGIPQTVGETFFTKRFFRDVLLRDKDLVRTFQEQRQKPPILGWFMTFIGAFLVLLLLGLAGYSLYRNHYFIQDATKKGQAVLANVRSDSGRNVLQKKAEETQAELNAIENLRKILVVMDDYERNGAPLYMRFGLYSGDRLYRDRLLDIYYSAVQRRFRDPAVNKLEADLRAFAAQSDDANPTNLTEDQEERLGKHYSLLEAYLMLSEEHRDRAVPSILSDTLKEYWVSQANLPPDNEELAEAQLNFYFKQIDRWSDDPNDQSAFPRITPKAGIVKPVREKLRSYPAYLRYLRRVITGVSKRVDPVSVKTLLDGRGKGVLTSAKEYEIPGAFTIEGYRNCPQNIEEVTERCVRDAINAAAQELQKEDWVMGRKETGVQAKEKEMSNLQQRYFNLYVDKWRELTRDAKIAEFKTIENMSEILKSLSDTESPMKVLLTGIARNTKFSSKPEPKGWFDLSWISDWWNSADAGAEETAVPVEREFRSLFKLIGMDEKADEKELLPIDAEYTKEMQRLDQIFGKLSAADKEEISREIDEKDKDSDAYTALDQAESRIDSLTQGFKSNAEEDIANLLMEPVAQIRNYFGADALSQLKRDWAQKLLPKAQEVTKGYPFTDDGEADLTELSKFLNPLNGQLSTFYKTRLQDQFEEKDGRLVPKESSKYKFSAEFVDYLNNAFRLRDALYGKTDSKPNFRYDFRLMRVEDAIIEVTIDGQKVTSESTGSSTLGFPAAQGASSGVLMRFASTGGTSSTSGSTLPPTSSANNSNSSVPTTTVPNYQQDTGEDRKTFQGSWGLFKFVDAGSKEKTGDEYTLTYQLGGKTVKATIKPQGGDLFDRSIFTSLKATPQTIIE